MNTKQMNTKQMNAKTTKAKGYVTAVIGSGGKTTLIEYLARQAVAAGEKAAIVTTTHMRLPQKHNGVGKREEEAISIMEEEGCVYCGSPAREKGKMIFPGDKLYHKLCEEADLILVEADGSRGLPMKVPDWPREPVIPENADEVDVVFGLTALGQPLAEVCQRWELGKRWIIGQESQPVTEELAVKFLINGYLLPVQKLFPEVTLTVILNQADTSERKEKGRRMARLLAEKGFSCKVARLKPQKLSMVYLASGYGSRFGGNKLLERLGDKRLFEHGLLTLFGIQESLEKELGLLSEVILVSQYPEILDFGEKLGLKTVENPYAAEGITASIRLGTKMAAEDGDYLLYSVADQPWLKGETIKGFLGRFLELSLRGAASIGCLCAEGRRGNPAVFHKRYREELCALTGDKGGSQVMKRYPKEVAEYLVSPHELEDIDCRQDIGK